MCPKNGTNSLSIEFQLFSIGEWKIRGIHSIDRYVLAFVDAILIVAPEIFSLLHTEIDLLKKSQIS